MDRAFVTVPENKDFDHLINAQIQRRLFLAFSHALNIHIEQRFTVPGVPAESNQSIRSRNLTNERAFRSSKSDRKCVIRVFRNVDHTANVTRIVLVSGHSDVWCGCRVVCLLVRLGPLKKISSDLKNSKARACFSTSIFWPPSKKCHWISNIPKWEHVSAHSEQVLFLGTPPTNVLSGHYGVCPSVRLLHKFFFSQISKIPKWEHVSANSEQLFFGDTPPSYNHQKWESTRFGLTYVWTKNFIYFFFFARPPKMTHQQNTLSAESVS